MKKIKKCCAFLLVWPFFWAITIKVSGADFLLAENKKLALEFDSVFIDGKREISIFPGEVLKMKFIFENRGKIKWESMEGTNPVFLSFKSKHDLSNNFQNWGWSNKKRIKMTKQFFDQQSNYQRAIFSCNFSAPQKIGQLKATLQLVVEGDDYVGFFGEKVDFILNIKEKNNLKEDKIDLAEAAQNSQALIKTNEISKEKIKNEKKISAEFQRILEAQKEEEFNQKNIKNKNFSSQQENKLFLQANLSSLIKEKYQFKKNWKDNFIKEIGIILLVFIFSFFILHFLLSRRIKNNEQKK